MQPQEEIGKNNLYHKKYVLVNLTTVHSNSERERKIIRNDYNILRNPDFFNQVKFLQKTALEVK